MPDIGRIGNAIAGFGAGLTGRGVAFQQQQLNNRKEKARMTEEERKQRQQAFFTDMIKADHMADNGDFAAIGELYGSRLDALNQMGNTENTDDSRIMSQLADIAQGGGPKAEEAQKRIKKMTTSTLDMGQKLGFLKAGSRGGMASASNKTYANGTSIRLLPDGSSTVVAPDGRQVTDPTEREELLQAAFQSEIQLAGGRAGAVADATLGAELKLKPSIAAAVEQAKAAVKLSFDNKERDRSNGAVLATYDSAMTGLAEALGGTITGPVAGWLPAVTANQQIAKGAGALMTPILKTIFREAGEGVFTDKDQELLTDMLPKRTDKQATIVWKVESIDRIVRAKLGVEQEAPPQVQAPAAGGFKVLSVQ